MSLKEMVYDLEGIENDIRKLQSDKHHIINNITKHLIENQMYDFFKIDLPKLKRSVFSFSY